MRNGGAAPANGTDDAVLSFQIGAAALRGRLIRLGPALDAILGRHAYPPVVARLLGEAVALAAALAGALKYEGIFTLQTKGDGPVRLLVADVTSAGAIRAYAQFDEAAVAGVLSETTSEIGAPVPRLLGAGYLAFTVDQGEHTERYQGIVDLDGATLADCAHHYFAQSEQVEAGLRVACHQTGSGWRAGAIMLQRLPLTGGTDAGPTPLSLGGELAQEADDEGWRRTLLLLGTCRDGELVDPRLGAESLIYRLFHEEGIRVWPPAPLADRCRCSRDRIGEALRSLPAVDRASLAEEGQISVTCEFCSTVYPFTADEIV